MCRRGSGSSASAGRAMAAGPAAPSTRRRPRSGRSPRASRPPPCSLMCWSPNTAIICRSTGRARSSPGRASSSTARPWRTGSAAPAGGWSRCRRRLAEHVFASQKLFADDTPIPVLDPGRGRTKTGRLWVYARDDRPWNGPDPPAAVYLLQPRSQGRASCRSSGRVQGHRCRSTAIPASSGSATGGNIQLAACWAHARRKFYDVHQATGSPIAAEALRRIAELYAIEDSDPRPDSRARQSVRAEPGRCRWSRR